jgi:hypothetical protein
MIYLLGNFFLFSKAAGIPLKDYTLKFFFKIANNNIVQPILQKYIPERYFVKALAYAFLCIKND